MARYPEIRQALDWLMSEADNALMTGSGACVFAAFDTEAEAHRVAAKAPSDLPVVVAEGVNHLPEMLEVQ